MRTTRLRVSLRDVDPPVVRVVDVPADTRLPELHDLLQAVMGWTDSHLHQFDVGDRIFGVPDDDAMPEQLDEADASLTDLPDRFSYLYDFGDYWSHDVEVVGPGDDTPGCRYGEGACPPENCGGSHGYSHLLQVLADPTHDEHAHLREWAGELRDFDQADTDLLIRQTVGQTPPSVRLVLDLAEGGVTLTPGGRLPRVFVRRVQEQRPDWHVLGRPAATENDLLPLYDLHDLLRQVGLLRLSKGVVRPTRAARNDQNVVRRLRSWFVPGSFRAMVVTDAVALLAANGPMSVETLVARVSEHFEFGWTSGNRPINSDVDALLHSLGHVLTALDLIDSTRMSWEAGPSARTLLPRASALAHLWTPR